MIELQWIHAGIVRLALEYWQIPFKLGSSVTTPIVTPNLNINNKLQFHIYIQSGCPGDQASFLTHRRTLTHLIWSISLETRSAVSFDVTVRNHVHRPDRVLNWEIRLALRICIDFASGLVGGCALFCDLSRVTPEVPAQLCPQEFLGRSSSTVSPMSMPGRDKVALTGLPLQRTLT